MWPFKKEPKYKSVLVTLRECPSCGSDVGMEPMALDDGAHCMSCGSIYLIGSTWVLDPVAKWARSLIEEG